MASPHDTEQPVMTRVLHVTTIPESLGFLKSQLPVMKARGYEVVAVSSPGPFLDDFGAQHGIPVAAVPMQRRIAPVSDLVALSRLVRVVRRVRPTILHAHTPKAGLLGMLAGLIAGTPVRVYHLRGLPLETARGPRRLLLRWTERVACFSAHRVLCVSHSLRRVALRERLCRPEKIQVLAGGSGQGVDATSRFDPQRVASARGAVRAKLSIPEGAPVVGFLGRLVRDKGIVELAEAWREIAEARPDAHLIVSGTLEADDAVPPAVVETLRRDPRVHLLDFDWDTPPLYAAMDVVTLPTYREGFPNVPLEAASMGLPMVATRVSGCVDAVVDGRTGTLVPPRDATALAAAIRRYLDDAALRATHGSNGRARVLAEFTPEVLANAVCDEYQRLLRRVPGPHYRALKRALDVVGASSVLLAGALPMAVCAAVIAVTMGTPVIFAHDRPGQGERTFKLYKFRTMTDDRDASGELLPDSERITRLGAFLRKSSLDELPELWNVLRGDMSLVGPRPLLVRYLPHFTEKERARHSVPPGITGWAQVHGRNEVDWDRRIALDVWYVENRTLRLDLEILLATAGLVFSRKGVVVDPRSTMLNFDEERLARAAEHAAAAQGRKPDVVA